MSSMWYTYTLRRPKLEFLNPAADVGVLEQYQWVFVLSHNDLVLLAEFLKYPCRMEEDRLAQQQANFCRSIHLERQSHPYIYPFDQQLDCKV